MQEQEGTSGAANGTSGSVMLGEPQWPVPSSSPQARSTVTSKLNVPIRASASHLSTAEQLLEYATKGCPTKTEKPETEEEMQAAVIHGSHESTMETTPIEQLKTEIIEKVSKGGAQFMLWDNINEDCSRHTISYSQRNRQRCVCTRTRMQEQ